MIDNDTPCIEERYCSAINASNLRVEADKGGAVDPLIAASWSASRVGASLMRLHTEFDGHAMASGEVDATAVRLLVMNLRSLPDVRREVSRYAVNLGMESPHAISDVIIAWWLEKVCQECHGRKFSMIQGTPSLSAKQCKCCRGTGEKQIPYGRAGQKLAIFIEDCVLDAQSSIRKRLFGIRR